MSDTRRQIPFLLGYGIGDFGLNIYWNSLSLILVAWYAEVAGLETQTAGFIYLIGSFWDAISDPVMAKLAERNRSRYGTYGPFILYGGLMLGAAFCLLFWVPPFTGNTLVIYLMITHIIFRTCYTLVAVPYSAMSSRITFDSSERTKLSSVRMMFAFAGLLSVSSLWFPTVRFLGGGEIGSGQGFFYAAIVGGLAGSLALMICFVSTKERTPPGKIESGNTSWLTDFVKAIRFNRALRVLLIMVFLQSGAYASLWIPLAFFIEANSYRFADIEVVLTAFAITVLCSVPIWMFITNSIGKKKVWMFASGWIALCGAHFLIFGPVLMIGLPVQIVLIGAGFGAFSMLIWAIIPDTIEFGQFKYGERAEGTVFGAVLFAQKVSAGMMGLVVGTVLSWIGYDADMEQQTTTVAENLGIFLALVPPVMLVFSSLVIMRLPLDKGIHAKIVDQLSQ